MRNAPTQHRIVGKRGQRAIPILLRRRKEPGLTVTDRAPQRPGRRGDGAVLHKRRLEVFQLALGLAERVADFQRCQIDVEPRHRRGQRFQRLHRPPLDLLRPRIDRGELVDVEQLVLAVRRLEQHQPDIRPLGQQPRHGWGRLREIALMGARPGGVADAQQAVILRCPAAAHRKARQRQRGFVEAVRQHIGRLVIFAQMPRQLDRRAGRRVRGGERGLHDGEMCGHTFRLEVLRADAVDRLDRGKLGAEHEIVDIEHQPRVVLAHDVADPVHRVRPGGAPDDNHRRRVDLVHPPRRVVDRDPPRLPPCRPGRLDRAHDAIQVARRVRLARNEDHPVGDHPARRLRRRVPLGSLQRWASAGRAARAPREARCATRRAAPAAPARAPGRPARAPAPPPATASS